MYRRRTDRNQNKGDASPGSLAWQLHTFLCSPKGSAQTMSKGLPQPRCFLHAHTTTSQLQPGPTATWLVTACQRCLRLCPCQARTRMKKQPAACISRALGQAGQQNHPLLAAPGPPAPPGEQGTNCRGTSKAQQDFVPLLGLRICPQHLLPAGGRPPCSPGWAGSLESSKS